MSWRERLVDAGLVCLFTLVLLSLLFGGPR